MNIQFILAKIAFDYRGVETSEFDALRFFTFSDDNFNFDFALLLL